MTRILRLIPSFGLFSILLCQMMPPLAAEVGPVLKIQPDGTNQYRLQWTPDLNLNVLEATPNLDLGFEWLAVGQAPEILGPHFQVTPPPGGSNQFFRLASRGLLASGRNAGTLPDPAGSAPLPPPSALEDFASSTAFLYDGTAPVQLGMAPGTIKAKRASVLRGKVKKRDGSALVGVRVAILNFPQFGYTFTRADGMFDLAVNGGPLYTVDYQAVGYCPIQRQVQAPVQDFRCLPEVVLVGMDPVATPVTFGAAAPLQVAMSHTNTDVAGTRSATLLFPPGTRASLLMPDGSTRDSSGLTIRATEFTVGPNGRQAMPAPLPASSAYTYAVELSGDEAVNAGARSVQFNQFIHVYVDNFLGLPAGALVPSGYYDRQMAAWVPQENGVVIRILHTLGGIAQLDVNGDGAAEDQAALDAAAFTTGELQYLAANYPVGKTLWRMPVKHFTALDFNCPENPADPGKPNAPGDAPSPEACPDCKFVGGDVETAQQVFHETIPLVGVPMGLHYSSARVPGYRVNAQLELPLTGATTFPKLLDVGVEMEIAGRLTERTYPAEPNQTEAFGWDGRDAYGRLVNDTRRAAFRLTYHYPQVYGGHALLANQGINTIGYGPPLFGNFGQFTSTIGHDGVGEAIVIDFERRLTIPDHRKLGLGGWSLTPLHRYDPYGRTLYLGDGTIQRPESLVNGVSVVEVSDAVRRGIIVAASDGSLFLAGSRGRVFRMTPSGLLVSLTAGEGGPGIIQIGSDELHLADGMPAAKVICNVAWYDAAVGPDDSLYLRAIHQIIRITPAGIIQLVLGGGPYSDPPDGTPGRAAQAGEDGSGGAVAVGPDNTVYYKDGWDLAGRRHFFLRKISTDGRISTIAGRAGPGGTDFEMNFEGFGGPAALSKTAPIRKIAVAPDGSLVLAAGAYIVRITTGGTLELVANGAALTKVGQNDDRRISEGTPAISSTPLHPGGPTYADNLCLGPDGTVYFTYGGDPSFLWKIDPAGIFQRVAGKWNAPYEAGYNPLQSSLGSLSSMTIDRSGTLSMITQPLGTLGSGPNTLRRIGPAQPGFDGVELPVAARHGSELYIFNAIGLHLRTVDTLTGTTNWLFTYNRSNLVTRIRNRDGLITQIERTVSGTPVAIIGPYGQRTQLAVDAGGFLSSVINPANEAVQLASDSKGLLLALTTPRGNTEHLAYDSLGRVVQSTDAGGGVRSWTRTGRTHSFAINDRAPEGSSKTVVLDLLTNGDTRIGRTSEEGIKTTEMYTTLGDRTGNEEDGSVFDLKTAVDPRFPGQTRVLGSETITLPGGLITSLSLSRTAKLNDPGDPLSLVTLTAQATANGQTYRSVYSRSTQTFAVVSPEGRSNHIELDSAGRVTSQKFAGLTVFEAGYDPQGRPTALKTWTADGRLDWHVSYDGLGRVNGVSDVLGRTYALAHDTANRVVEETFPDGSKAGFGYNGDSRLVSITPPGRPPHQFSYDAVGRRVQYSPPAAGGGEAGTLRYQYDADGRLTRLEFSDGQIQSISYTASGKRDQVVLGSGPTLHYAYDPQSGSPTRIDSSAGEHLSFKRQGPLTTRTAWTGSVTGSVSLQFNASLLPAVQSINEASPIQLEYDGDSLLTRVGDLTLARDPGIGRVVALTLGTVSEKWDYDERGLRTNHVVTTPDRTILRATFAYDVAARLVHKRESVEGTTHDYDYTYSLAGRLARVLRDGQEVGSFTYDPNGNRLTSGVETATYDNQDRVLTQGASTFEWSPNGTLARRSAPGGNTTFNYDVRDALLAVGLPDGTHIDYAIDPLGRRIARRVNNVLEAGWLYDESRPVVQLDSEGNVAIRFVYAEPGLTPAYMIKDADTYRVIADERGSVRLIIRVADGSIAQELDYDSFGKVLIESNPGFQPFGFAGGLTDRATGLVRFGARDYDPATGRWTAKDPGGFAGGLNLFAYAANDPVNRVDIDGRGAAEIGGGVLLVWGLYEFYELNKTFQDDLRSAQSLQRAIDASDRREVGGCLSQRSIQLRQRLPREAVRTGVDAAKLGTQAQKSVTGVTGEIIK